MGLLKLKHETHLGLKRLHSCLHPVGAQETKRIHQCLHPVGNYFWCCYVIKQSPGCVLEHNSSVDFDLFLDQTSVVEFIHRKLADCKLAVELDACLHRCLFCEFSSISGKLYLREIDGCFFVFQDHTVHSSQIVHCDVHLWRRIFGGVVYNPGGVFVAR